MLKPFALSVSRARPVACGEFAAHKDPGDDRRHLEECASRSSGKDLGEAVCKRRPAGARATRTGDVIIWAVLLRPSRKRIR